MQTSMADKQRYLDGLSALAARSFPSTREAMAGILAMIVGQLGVRSSFLSHIAREENRSEILATYNAPGGCDVTPGALLELPGVF